MFKFTFIENAVSKMIKCFCFFNIYGVDMQADFKMGRLML